jgi:hypothetical protein
MEVFTAADGYRQLLCNVVITTRFSRSRVSLTQIYNTVWLQSHTFNRTSTCLQAGLSAWRSVASLLLQYSARINKVNKQVYEVGGSRVSSGSVVSDYGLDDRAIGVLSPAGAEDFSSSLCVQTDSGAHPAYCTMGTGGLFPRGKARPGRDADHSSPSSAEVVSE